MAGSDYPSCKTAEHVAILIEVIRERPFPAIYEWTAILSAEKHEWQEVAMLFAIVCGFTIVMQITIKSYNKVQEVIMSRK